MADEDIILSVKLDGADTSIKTLGELKTAIALLEEELDGLELGSEAFTANKKAIESLTNEYVNLTKSAKQSANELKDIADKAAENEALNYEKRKKKALEFGDNLAKLAKGVVDTTTGIALAFGASKESTDEFEKSIASIVGISSSIKGGIEVITRSIALMGGPLTIVIGLVGALVAAFAFFIDSETEYEKVVRETNEALKEQEEQSKLVKTAVSLQYDTEISKAKAAGQDVRKLQEEKFLALIAESKAETANLIHIRALRKAAFDEQIEQYKQAGGIFELVANKVKEQENDKNSELYKSRKEINDKIIASQQQTTTLENQLRDFNTENRINDEKKAEEDNKKATDAYLKNLEKKKNQEDKDRELIAKWHRDILEADIRAAQEKAKKDEEAAKKKEEREKELTDKINKEAAKRLADAKKYAAELYTDEEKSYKARQEALDTAYKYKLISDEEYAKQAKAIENGRKEKINETTDAIQNVAGGLNDFLGQLNQNSIDKLNQQEEAQLANKNLTEEQKFAIESKFVAQRNEILKKEFRRNKAFQLANSVIDGTQAVIKAFGSAPPPFNFILAGAAGIFAALQTAKIAATKFEGESGPSAPTSSLGGAAGGSGSSAAAQQPTDLALYGSAGAFNNVTKKSQGGTNYHTVDISIGVDEVTKKQQGNLNYAEAVELK